MRRRGGGGCMQGRPQQQQVGKPGLGKVLKPTLGEIHTRWPN